MLDRNVDKHYVAPPTVSCKDPAEASSLLDLPHCVCDYQLKNTTSLGTVKDIATTTSQVVDDMHT